MRVSLQYKTPLGLPRAERRLALEQIFAEIDRDVLAPRGAALEKTSLSISGQTVEAVLPREHFDELVADLRNRAIQVDLDLPRQVVPPF